MTKAWFSSKFTASLFARGQSREDLQWSNTTSHNVRDGLSSCEFLQQLDVNRDVEKRNSGNDGNNVAGFFDDDYFDVCSRNDEGFCVRESCENKHRLSICPCSNGVDQCVMFTDIGVPFRGFVSVDDGVVESLYGVFEVVDEFLEENHHIVRDLYPGFINGMERVWIEDEDPGQSFMAELSFAVETRVQGTMRLAKMFGRDDVIGTLECFEFHSVPVNQTVVHIDGSFYSLGRVIHLLERLPENYSVNSTMHDQWHFAKCRGFPQSELPSRLVYRLKNWNDRLRHRFMSSVFVYCGVRPRTFYRASNKNRAQQLELDRQTKVAGWDDDSRFEFQSSFRVGPRSGLHDDVRLLAISSCVEHLVYGLGVFGTGVALRLSSQYFQLQNDDLSMPKSSYNLSDYDQLDLVLDVLSLSLTHFRLSPLEGEIGDLLDALLQVIECCKTIKWSSSWISVYASLCALARYFGVKIGSVLNALGVKLSLGSGRHVFRVGRPPVEKLDPNEWGSGLETEMKENPTPVVDIGGGIFVEKDGTEFEAQAGFRDLGEGAKSLAWQLFKSLFNVGMALSIHKAFKQAIDPSVLLYVTRDSVRSSSESIIDVFTSMLRCLTNLDFWSAFGVFKGAFFGKDAEIVSRIAADYSAVDSDVKMSAPVALVRLSSLKRELTAQRAESMAVGRSSLVSACDALLKQLSASIEARTQILQLSSIKVPPLCLIGVGLARTGKTIIPLATMAALGNVYGLDHDLRRQVTYYPQTGSQYWEGYDAHMHVHIDEVNSISEEVDQTVGAKLGSILDIVSPVPTGLNMAFEKKGKVNTTPIKAITLNTNSDVSGLVQHFKNPDALYGRAKFVVVKPGDAVRDSNRFVPSKLDRKDVETLSGNVTFSVYSLVLDNPHVPPRHVPEFEGDLGQFVVYITGLLKDGVSGSRAEVSRMFAQVSSIDVVDGVAKFPDMSEKVLLSGEFEAQAKFSMRKLFGVLSDTCRSCRVATVDAVVQVVATDRFVEYSAFFQRWRAFIMKVSGAIAGVLALVKIYTMMRQRSLQPQLEMPKPLPDGSLPDGETREFMGKLFSTKTLGVDNSYVVPAFGGGVIDPAGLMKIERNTVRVTVTNVTNGVSGLEASVFGYVMDGYVLTVSHVFLETSTSARVVCHSNIAPRGFESSELKKSMWRKVPGVDVALVPCKLPPGKCDLKAKLKFGKARVGQRVILLAAGDRPRVEGYVKSIEDFIFENEGLSVTVLGAIVTSISGTVTGDCSRLLVAVSDEGLTLVGIHFGLDKSRNLAVATPVPMDRITEIAKQMKFVPQAMCRDDISFGVMMHPEQVHEGVPKRGVFADPYFHEAQKLLPIVGVADNARGGKSHLRKSVFYDDVAPILKDLGVEYAPAVLRSEWRYDDKYETNRLVSPYHYGLDFTSNVIGCPQQEALSDCVDGVEKLLSPHISKTSTICSLDDSLHSVGIMKPVALSTGAGMHVPGKKGDFMWELSIGGETVRAAGQELRESVNDLTRRLIKGDVPPGVSKIALKDEILKIKKVVNMSTRMIHVVSLDEYVLGRMIFAVFLEKLYTLLQAYFGMCFVVNAHGKDWTWIYNRSVSSRGGKRSRLGADFRAFDLHHQFLFMFFAFELLLRLALRGIVMPDAFVRVIACYLWMKLVRVTRVDGVWIYCFLGGPSGDIFTVYFNCVCQLFYWYVTWYTIRGGGTFEEFMSELGDHWCSLGDDCSLAVPVEVSAWLTCPKIISVMRERCGQEITGDGLKSDLEYGGEGEFLKRHFRVVGDFVFAPLKLESCLKMLLYFEEKESVASNAFRNFQLLSTVWEESFFHDDVVKDMLRSLVTRLRPKLDPRFRSREFRSDSELLEAFKNGTLGLWDRWKPSDEFEAQCERAGEYSHHQDSCPSREAVCEEMIKVQEKAVSVQDRRLVSSVWRLAYALLPKLDKDSRGVESPSGGVLRLAEQTIFGNNESVPAPSVVVNPGDEAEVAPDKQQLGTATFDGTFQKVSIDRDGPVRVGLGVGELAIFEDEFFLRPIKIAEISWSSSMTPASILPHKLWFNELMVTNRFQGWSRTRFDLVLRFEYSPSFYHYGLARAWWYPMYPLIGTTASSPVLQVSPAKGSQAHGVWLDAAQPGTRELIIPWDYYVDAINTAQSLALSNVGYLWFSPLVPLARSDSATPGTISVVVRAYARNVVRAGPTRKAVEAQSGKSDKSVGTTVQKPGPLTEGLQHATKAFGAVAKIPLIAPFAKGAEVVTSALSSVAGYFGWSRDLVRSRQTILNRPARYGALDDDDTVVSLAYMKDQGLFGNPSDLCGIKEDEMTVAYIGGHDSVIQVYTISTSDSYDVKIIEFPVHPMSAWYDGSAYYTPSAVGWLTGAFLYWRGSLVYTFRCVCANQHSGSLRISYDPNGDTPTAGYPNEMSRTCVLELKPGACAEIVVGWSQPVPWIRRKTAYSNPANDSLVLCNGALRGYVLNPVNAPLSTQGVQIVVSVKAGPDFAVFFDGTPPDIDIDTTPPAIVAGGEDFELQASSVTNVAAVGHCHFGGPFEPVESIQRHVFGESILSIRSFLKRYHYIGQFNADTAGAAGRTNKSFGTAGPLCPTSIGGSDSYGTTTNKITATKLAYMRWFKCLYAGHRGGMRFKFRRSQDWLAGVSQGTAWYRFAVDPDAAALATATSNTGTVVGAFQAAEVFDESKDDYCEVKVPDYAAFRYTPGGMYKVAAGTDFGYWGLVVTRPCEDATLTSYSMMIAIDEDFNFINFIGAPVVIQNGA